MLTFAPGLLISLLAMTSCVVGGVVRGAVVRDVIAADAGNVIMRAVDAETPAPSSSEPPTATPVPGALFAGSVHQELGW